MQSSEIMQALRASVTAIEHWHCISTANISTWLMWLGGAMALLLAGVGGERIKILGRWKSNIIMRYLHTTARPLLQSFASCMVENGNYNLLPGEKDHLVPDEDSQGQGP